MFSPLTVLLNSCDIFNMTKPSSSSSSGTSSFTEEFIALWSNLICRLSFTYACLTIQLGILGEIFAYFKGKRKHLPANHPFRTDFNEFCMTFDYGLQAFLEIRPTIERHAVIESEYFNKKELTEHAEKVYFDSHRILETACVGLVKLSHSKDAKAELMDIVTRRLQENLSYEERVKDETERKGLIKLLARINEDFNFCRALVNYLEEQANTCFETLTTLERESNQEYSTMNANSFAYHHAVEENRHQEGHLSNFILKFRSHIGGDRSCNDYP